MGCIQKSHSISPNGEYIPGGRTVLHTIPDNHFNDFVENYEVKYAEECGRYSLDRITSVVEEYLKCGDYKQGIARVKCTNPECFRRRVIRFFIDRELITKDFASNLLIWKNSGFSIDAKLRLYGSDDKARESIAQYLVRPPLSLSKITYEEFKGKVLFKTKYNEYFGENFKVYTAADFIAALTQHIPPARVHLVRYYGLYSSRSRGTWKDMPYIVRLSPEGWIKKQEEQDIVEEDGDIKVENQEVKGGAKHSAWARLINKVYGINPLICEKCGSAMQIVAFIMDPEQINKILRHLINTGKSPPGLNPSSLN